MNNRAESGEEMRLARHQSESMPAPASEAVLGKNAPGLEPEDGPEDGPEDEPEDGPGSEAGANPDAPAISAISEISAISATRQEKDWPPAAWQLLELAARTAEASASTLASAATMGEALRADLTKIHEAATGLQLLTRATLKQYAWHEVPPDELARIRHRLRTPLNHLLGYSEILLEEPEVAESPLGAELRALHDSGKLALTLISEGLRASEFSDRASPQGNVSPIPVSITPALGVRAADQPGGRILVVDDNPANRDVLAQRLRREGHQPTLAADGPQALALLAEHEFDVILLDVIMPGMDGLQVLDAIRADARWRRVPVLMISALDDVQSVIHCIERGAVDYLPKPFDPVLLRARIGACLEQKRWRDREAEYLARIEAEQQKTESILRAILPGPVVEQIKQAGVSRPMHQPHVALMFADIVGFTPFCERCTPEVVVQTMNGLMISWENVLALHGVEKIKSTGDGILAAYGLFEQGQTRVNFVECCVRCALDLLAVTEGHPAKLTLRVGVNYGGVVGGVIGARQFLFDLWGDAVNTAARMESHGVPGAITLSRAAWDQVEPLAEGESLGAINVKGKGIQEIIRFTRFRA